MCSAAVVSNVDQFLVYEDGLARLSNFAASGYKGHDGLGMENESHYMPRDPGQPNSVEPDSLDLGSMLYELITGKPPYHDRSGVEIEALYKREEFLNMFKGTMTGLIREAQFGACDFSAPKSRTLHPFGAPRAIGQVRVNRALEGSDMVLGAAWASVPRHNELLHHESSILEGLYNYLRLQM